MKESQIKEAVAKTIEAINHASPLNPGYVGIIIAALKAEQERLDWVDENWNLLFGRKVFNNLRDAIDSLRNQQTKEKG